MQLTNLMLMVHNVSAGCKAAWYLSWTVSSIERVMRLSHMLEAENAA